MTENDPTPVTPEERQRAYKAAINSMVIWAFLLFACIAPILFASGLYGLLVGFGGEWGAAMMLAVGTLILLVQLGLGWLSSLQKEEE